MIATPSTLPHLTRRGMLGLSLAAVAAASGCRSATDSAGSNSELTMAYAKAPDPTKLMRRVVDSPSYVNLVFDRLVDLDPKTMAPVPWLAESWDYSADRRKLVLRIRDGVEFHNGRTLTADDVVFSLNVARDPKTQSQVAPVLQRLADIKATGPREVTLTLAKPTSNLFDVLMYNPVVDSTTYDQIASTSKVIGSGPFRWDEFSAGQRLRVVRFDGHWRAKPDLTTVTVRAVDSAQAQLSALQAGQVQLVGGIPGRDIKPVAAAGKYTLIETRSSYQQTYLGVDVKTPPFDNPEVRRALQYAIDRARVLNQVYGGYGQMSCLPWPSNTPGVTQDQVSRYGHDPARAADMLKAAGAHGARINLYAASTPIFSSVLDVVQYDLTQAGFNVKAELMDPTEFQTRVRQARLPGLNIANLGLVSVSPLTGISNAAPARPGKNPSRLTDPAYRQLQDRAYAAATEAETAQVNHDLGEYFLKQSFHLTLAHAYDVLLADAAVTDVKTTFLGYLDLAHTRRSK